MNNVRLQKYSYPPEAVEENAVKSEKFREICNFYRLFKVKEHAERYACTDAKKDKTLLRHYDITGTSQGWRMSASSGGTFEEEGHSTGAYI